MKKSKKGVPKRRQVNEGQGKRLVIVLSITLACVVVWGGFLFLSLSGPKKVDRKSSENSKTPEESSTSIDKGLTEKSAEELKTLSVELEREAKALMDSEDYEAASDKYQEAFQIQKNINRNHPQSPQNDISRALNLQLEARNAAAEPLFIESSDFEQQAESFAEAGDVELATEAFNQAIATQKQLNSEHRDARQVSAVRLVDLRRRLAKLKSDEVYAKISDVSEQAESLKELGDLDAAEELFREAALLQKQLNEDFPDSPYASLLQVSEFQKQEQIIKSTSIAQELKDRSVRLDQLLAMRNTGEAISLLEDLHSAVQAFEEDFPLSPLIDDAFKTKIAYLHQKRTELAAIQGQVYDALLSVPDVDGIRMLRTEVPQSFYVQLMDSNPSRNQADSNPVDSVSWLEANTFCERLSRILGKAVRLPSEEEFRKALQEFDPSNASDLIWSVTDAQGFSKPTGQKKPFPSGYFDLLGNVSEWLAPEDVTASNMVYHIGGNARDVLEAIVEVPVLEMTKTSRSRMTGFRIVVLD